MKSRRLLQCSFVVCSFCAVSRMVYAFGVPPVPKKKHEPPKTNGHCPQPRKVQKGDTEPLLPATPGAISRNEKVGIDLVEIRAGWFKMGSPNGTGDDDEHPQHMVYLDRYRIAKTEVTVAQFRRYCESSGYSYDWNGMKPSWGYVDDYPMVNVTWDEALAYCKWAGGDLPTEAEWEKAAKGTDGRVYPWTGDWDADKCVDWSNSDGRPAPVGSKPKGASPYGVLDMAGNVFEWCKDFYDGTYYRHSPKRNPLNSNNAVHRVLRSHPFSHGFRCADRIRIIPDKWNFGTIGFRPVFTGDKAVIGGRKQTDKPSSITKSGK